MRAAFFYCFFLLVLSGIYSPVQAGNTEEGITINKKNTSLEKIMAAIKKQSGYTFWYKANIPARANKITISVKNASLTQALDICAAGQPFTYKIIGKVIVLKPDAAFFNQLPAEDIKEASKKTRRQSTIVSNGYQQFREDESASSITRIDGSQINQNTGSGGFFSNTSVPGMQTTTDAKGNTSVLIHGRNSISSGTDPLILVDGVPYSGTLDQLDKSNIESVNILKDADATSIYGSRGGNGVIVVTTKKGAATGGGAGTIDEILGKFITEKDGFYIYTNANVYAVFRNIGKRFDMEVIYKASAPEGVYCGEIPGSLSSSEMLEIAAAAGIHFTVEKMPDGKQKITVI